jgi:hypothetical protein
MSIGIYELLGEQKVREIDNLAVALVGYGAEMTYFVDGRRTAGTVFATQDVPESLEQAVSAVRSEVKESFGDLVDKPEFILGVTLAAYAIRKDRGNV